MAVSEPSVVDAIGFEGATDTLVLTMIEPRYWSEAPSAVQELTEKVDSYVEFLNSGQVFETHGDYRGKPVRVDLICRYEPPPAVWWAFRSIASQLTAREVSFSVKVHSDAGKALYELDFFAS